MTSGTTDWKTIGMTTPIQAEARLRPRSQLTLPESIVDATGLEVGDRFLVVVDADDPDTVRLHRIRGSYAGSMRAVYDEPTAYLEGERRSWERGDHEPA